MSYDENNPVVTTLKDLRALLSGTLAVASTPVNLTLFQLTILAGQSLSNAVDLGSHRILRIDMPSAWTDANIMVLVSADGVDYGAMFDVWSTLGAPSAGARLAVVEERPARLLSSIRYLKFRSIVSGGYIGSVLPSAPAVNQAADRVITLVTA